MNQSKRSKHVKKSKGLTQKTSAPSPKWVKSRVPEEKLEVADNEEMANLGDAPDVNDPNFRSELNYDGYRSIEEYDNDVYSQDRGRDKDSKGDLIIEDREEDSKTGEEDLLDPQENKK